ncbi:thioredoxin domain-containing protein [Candidatus Woesearchaeota archaeon]|nr:thioredoxin domain-containing protein [Candidatus Woesearchaeota archaeon]
MKDLECKICNQKFGSEESLRQHTDSKHPHNNEKDFNTKKLQSYLMIFLILAAIVIFSYTFYLRYQTPGQYDEFAKCMTEKGAVIYGNDFCSYTNKQMNFFEKSKKYLNYIKCAENKELCDAKGVKVTPTWEINGKMYAQVQSFERLSEITGCKI